jgi:hypothetical protein
MGKWFAGTAAILFFIVAWAPWVPPFDALKAEMAHVVAIDTATGWATFQLADGRNVKCQVRGKYSATLCSEQKLSDAMSSGRSLRVWLDGTKVYQVSNGDVVVLSHAAFLSGRTFSIALGLIFLVIYGFCFESVKIAMQTIKRPTK